MWFPNVPHGLFFIWDLRELFNMFAPNIPDGIYARGTRGREYAHSLIPTLYGPQRSEIAVVVLPTPPGPIRAPDLRDKGYGAGGCGKFKSNLCWSS